jgi:hypothetical protein
LLLHALLWLPGAHDHRGCTRPISKPETSLTSCHHLALPELESYL